MNRTRDYYRKQRAKHINRKKRIIHELIDYWGYKHDGVLSKGKIHCSCWMCSGKTKVHGWKPRDLRELEGIKCELNEYYREAS